MQKISEEIKKISLWDIAKDVLGDRMEKALREEIESLDGKGMVAEIKEWFPETAKEDDILDDMGEFIFVFSRCKDGDISCTLDFTGNTQYWTGTSGENIAVNWTPAKESDKEELIQAIEMLVDDSGFYDRDDWIEWSYIQTVKRLHDIQTSLNKSIALIEWINRPEEKIIRDLKEKVESEWDWIKYLLNQFPDVKTESEDE